MQYTYRVLQNMFCEVSYAALYKVLGTDLNIAQLLVLFRLVWIMNLYFYVTVQTFKPVTQMKVAEGFIKVLFWKGGG